MRIEPKYLFISIHLLIWAGIFFLFCPEPVGQGLFSTKLFSPEENLWFFIYGFLLNVGIIYSYAHMALPIYLKINRIQYFLLINAAFIVGMTFFESWLDYFYHHISSSKYLKTYWSWVANNLVFTTIVLLAANLYGFTFAWFKDQRNRQALVQAKLQAELSALKHQVNPHFLFNILNGLYGLAFKNDDEPTAEGIAKLSQLMRYMLYESNSTYVPLAREIEYVNNYIDLQKIRTNGTTDIQFSVSGIVEGKQVAPMMFIPFIENAFKHGISTVQPSSIHIFMKVEDKQLTFKVSNPIHTSPFKHRDSVGGIGLNNVVKRLDLLYKGTYKLFIDDTEDQFKVELTLAL